MMGHIQKQFYLGALVLGLAALVGCSSVNTFIGKFKTYADLDAVTIIRQKDINNNQYVLVDIAFIYSDDVNAMLLPKKAADWFAQKDSYLSMSKKKIEVIVHQPIPLGLINPVDLPKNKAKAKRIVLYVAYYGKNAFFQFDLTNLKKVQINIAEEKPVIVEI